MIYLFVPLNITDQISRRVLDSWKVQTIPVEIHECRTSEGEIASRKLCISQASKIVSKPNYIIMADDDRACINSNDNYKIINTNVEDAQTFLNNNQDYGAISLVKPKSGNDENDLHIDIGWVMYRSKILLDLSFDVKGDLCIAVTSQIRNLGSKFDYLDSKNRIMHV